MKKLVVSVAIVATLAVGTMVWWTQRTAEEDAIYDDCFVTNGNRDVCDALIRQYRRWGREAAMQKAEDARLTPNEKAMKQHIEKLIATGFSKREVIEYVTKESGSPLCEPLAKAEGLKD
jgi:hypothetical protein